MLTISTETGTVTRRISSSAGSSGRAAPRGRGWDGSLVRAGLSDLLRGFLAGDGADGAARMGGPQDILVNRRAGPKIPAQSRAPRRRALSSSTRALSSSTRALSSSTRALSSSKGLRRAQAAVLGSGSGGELRQRW
ncbi:hypothetical protein GCM10009616_20660 [Microlunatus lacustris]